MEWMSFIVGMCAGVFITFAICASVLLYYALPFYRLAKGQRETQDKVLKNWVEQLAEAAKAQAEAHESSKWGGGNS